MLDMHIVQEQLEDYMQILSHDGGHHQLENPQNMNTLIQQIEYSFLQQKSV